MFLRGGSTDLNILLLEKFSRILKLSVALAINLPLLQLEPFKSETEISIFPIKLFYIAFKITTVKVYLKVIKNLKMT